MSGIVSDIQEQIKTIKIQKQLMKDSRKNEEGELEASINMLENFKKGNNIKKQEEAITYATSNSNNNNNNNNNYVNNNDNINIHSNNDDIYMSSNTNQRSNSKSNSNNNLRNMNVYRENSGVQYNNNNALFNNNNRQMREESKCDDSKNEENNYNNNQLYSYSNINTNPNNEDNNNFDENFNCDVRPINKNSFIYKHSKERENRDQRETNNHNNHNNHNNYEINNTYSNRENNNFINNNNKMSKYENFLSEFDQLTTKKKEEVKPTILDKLASNKQKDDYSNYQSLGKISSVQTNNHNHCNNNNTFEILSSNEEGLLKQNRERKAKSFLTKAEEKIHNYEQRKNEKKTQLMDMLTGTGGNDFNENYNNFNANIKQNNVTNHNHGSSSLYQTHTSNNGFNLGNYNQNEKNLNSAYKVRSQIKNLVNAFDSHNTFREHSVDKPKLLQKIEGKNIVALNNQPISHPCNIKLTDPTTLLTPNTTKASKNNFSKNNFYQNNKSNDYNTIKRNHSNYHINSNNNTCLFNKQEEENRLKTDFADFSNYDYNKSSNISTLNILNWENNPNNSKNILGNKNSYSTFNNFNGNKLFNNDKNSSNNAGNSKNNSSNQYNIKIEDVRSIHHNLRFLSEDNIRKMNDVLAEELMSLGLTIQKTFESRSKLNKMRSNISQI